MPAAEQGDQQVERGTLDETRCEDQWQQARLAPGRDAARLLEDACLAVEERDGEQAGEQAEQCPLEQRGQQGDQQQRAGDERLAAHPRGAWIEQRVETAERSSEMQHDLGQAATNEQQAEPRRRGQRLAGEGAQRGDQQQAAAAAPGQEIDRDVPIPMGLEPRFATDVHRSSHR